MAGPFYKLNFPIETPEAYKFWKSKHKCNHMKAVIAFSTSLENANENMRRDGYSRFWRERAIATYGKYVNNPSMIGVPFTEMETPWWLCMKYDTSPVDSGTVALIGGSPTLDNTVGLLNNQPERQTDYGWANWLSSYLGGFDIIKNFALDTAKSGPFVGQDTGNVLAQVTQALAVNPKWIWMDFGIVRDMQNTSIQANQTLAFIDQILEALKSVPVIAINGTPLGSGHPAATQDRKDFLIAVNAGLAQRCERYSNVTLIDAYSLVVDPATGNAKDGWVQSDNKVHFVQRTARAIANKGFELVANKVTIVDTKSPKSDSDVYNATTNPNRAQRNPKLKLLGTSASGTLSGPVPFGCALGSAALYFSGTSSVDTTNGGWTVDITGSDGTIQQLGLVLATGQNNWLKSGDTVAGGFKMKLSGLKNLISVIVRISVSVDGTTYTLSSCLEASDRRDVHNQASKDISDANLVVRLPPAIVPAGSQTSGILLYATAIFSSQDVKANIKFEDVWLERTPV